MFESNILLILAFSLKSIKSGHFSSRDSEKQFSANGSRQSKARYNEEEEPNYLCSVLNWLAGK